MIMFRLCEAQNLRIVYYLKTFATKQKWNRIIEMVDFILPSLLTLLVVPAEVKNAL